MQGFTIDFTVSNRVIEGINFDDDNNAFAWVYVDLDKKTNHLKASVKSYKAVAKNKKYRFCFV